VSASVITLGRVPKTTRTLGIWVIACDLRILDRERQIRERFAETSDEDGNITHN